MSFLGIDPRDDCKTKRDADLYDSSQISQQQKTDLLPVKLGESVELVLKCDQEEFNGSLDVPKCDKAFDPSEGDAARKLRTRHRKLVIGLTQYVQGIFVVFDKRTFYSYF